MIRKLRTKEVVLVKIFWINQFVEEATWEAEKNLKARYPQLFTPQDENAKGTYPSLTSGSRFISCV